MGAYTADQLLVPMALAGGGSFLTGPLSLHTTTNIEVMRRFLPHLQVRVTPMAGSPDAGGATLNRVELSHRPG